MTPSTTVGEACSPPANSTIAGRHAAPAAVIDATTPIRPIANPR
jgi:hypothetical protein